MATSHKEVHAKMNHKESIRLGNSAPPEGRFSTDLIVNPSAMINNFRSTVKFFNVVIRTMDRRPSGNCANHVRFAVFLLN